MIKKLRKGFAFLLVMALIMSMAMPVEKAFADNNGNPATGAPGAGSPPVGNTSATGLASKYKIKSAKLDDSGYSVVYLVEFESDIANAVANYWGGESNVPNDDFKAARILINDNTTEFKYDYGVNIDISRDSKKVMKISGGALAALKEKSPASFKVRWADNTESVFKEKSWADDLVKGVYTITMTAYEEGTRMLQESKMIQAYFDPKVKLIVEDNGDAFVEILVKNMAYLLTDFIIESEGEFKTGERTDLGKKLSDGSRMQAIYKIPIKNLMDAHKGGVLVSIMGGTPDKKGKWNEYKKFDMKFNGPAVSGFDEYEAQKLEKEIKEKSNQILQAKLIEANLDVNNDNKVDQAELEAAAPNDGKLAIQGSGSNKLADIDFLKHLGKGVKELDLSGNIIEKLPDGGFEKATELEVLTLDNNNIKELPKDVFKNNPKLRVIYINGNPMKNPVEGVLENQVNLEELSMSNTQITALPKNFVSNCPKLRVLFLDQNELSEIGEDIFAGKSELKDINLASNRLKKLPDSIGDLLELERFNVSGNEIEALPQRFSSLQTIFDLDLSHNKIKKIDDEIFVNMVKGSGVNGEFKRNARMDVSYNMLKKVPFAEMAAARKTSARAMNLKVQFNYLNDNPSAYQIATFDSINVLYREGGFLPQRTSVGAEAEAKDGKISLSQRLNMLELRYFQMADNKFLTATGKSFFKTRREFEKYIQEGARRTHNVPMEDSREDAAYKLLKARGVETWNILTRITKISDGQTSIIYEKLLDDSPKDALEMTFDDPQMKEGDEYIITREFYEKTGATPRAMQYDFEVNCKAVKSSGGSSPGTPGTPGTQPPAPGYKMVKVFMVRDDNPSKLSIADGVMQRYAKVQNVGEKSQVYTIYFKPMPIPGSNDTGNVISLTVGSGNDKQLAGKSKGSGTYDNEFTFTRESLNETRIPLTFEVDKMPMPADAVLVVDWDGTFVPEGGAAAPPSFAGVVTDDKKDKKKDAEQDKKKDAVTSGGYIQGNTAGEFMPEGKVSRAEIAVMLSKLLDTKDVKPDAEKVQSMGAADWYKEAAGKLVEMNIMSKYPDGKFNGDVHITRAELAAMIARAKNLKAKDAGFSDVKSTHWASKVIGACSEAGYIKGYPDGTFKPDNKITRAEVVVILNRVFKIDGENLKTDDKSIKSYIDIKKDFWAYKEIMAASSKIK